MEFVKLVAEDRHSPESFVRVTKAWYDPDSAAFEAAPSGEAAVEAQPSASPAAQTRVRPVLVAAN